MTRLVSGVVLAAAFLALIWFAPTPVLLAVALGVAALAFAEFARIAEATGARVPWIVALAATLAACAAVPLPSLPLEVALAGGLVASAAAVMATTGVAGPRPGLVHGAAAALAAPLYIGVPLGTLVAIHAATGRAGVLLLVGTIVVSDSSQYYVGRALGRTPLAPSLSPKKTREGALGGFVIAPLLLAAAGNFALPGAAPLSLAILGVVLVAAGIAGDLFESMLKRAAGVKDSAALIPGHGGVLDRIDALLFAAPVFYAYLRL